MPPTFDLIFLEPGLPFPVPVATLPGQRDPAIGIRHFRPPRPVRRFQLGRAAEPAQGRLEMAPRLLRPAEVLLSNMSPRLLSE